MLPREARRERARLGLPALPQAGGQVPAPARRRVPGVRAGRALTRPGSTATIALGLALVLVLEADERTDSRSQAPTGRAFPFSRNRARIRDVSGWGSWGRIDFGVTTI